MQLTEVLDNILEHLPAPKQQHHHWQPYTPQVQQTLSACLSVSRQLRHLAAERLFQTLLVKSSIDQHHLNILLRIIQPPPSQEWMSIRPFIRTLIFSIDSSFIAIHRFIPLFNSLAISNGNHITHFEFRVSPTIEPTTPIFNRSFEDAVLHFIKLPTLHSLQIHGRFFTRDFLLGTHIRDVGISGHGIDLNLESNDLYIEDPSLRAAPSNDGGSEEQLAYPRLQRFKTDLVWPSGFPERALDSIFRDLARLNVEINISHAFIKAEVLIKKSFSTLTTLIITYNFDGYEAELPTTWSINFGELKSLETLEYNWKNSISSAHQNIIRRGCRPLAGLRSLLDTIRTPMHSLATIRWNFCYLLDSLPPDVLSNWLETDIRWQKLDELLASSPGMFPRLEFVSLDFCPVVVVNSHEARQLEDEDFGIVASVLSENRQRAFPGLTASLGGNFLFKAKGGTVFADKS